MAMVDPTSLSDSELIAEAIETLLNLGGYDGSHHKEYAIDQAIRVLTRCPTVKKEAVDVRQVRYEYDALGESELYRETIRAYEDGEDGPRTYEWEVGIGP